MSHILTSWKEIATYLGKGVRTAQRWEHSVGLPVRRPNGGDSTIVLAYVEEIDDWLKKPAGTASFTDAGDKDAEIARLRLANQQLTIEIARLSKRCAQLEEIGAKAMVPQPVSAAPGSPLRSYRTPQS
ncbi:hypothetical protein [Candidatus Korobacter versatilis]|nr:hypothetical protein [Candidatus Koribacter versatilis]